MTMETKNEKKPLFWSDCGRIATFALGHFLIAGICYVLCVQALNADGNAGLFSLALFIAHYGTIFAAFTLLIVLVRLLGRRAAGIFAVVFGFLTLLALIIDTGIFMKWHFHFNLPILGLFFSPTGLELINFPLSMYIEGIAGILVIGAFEWALWRLCRKFYFPRVAIAVACICLVVTPVFHLWNAWVFFHNRNEEMIRTEAVPFFFGLMAETFLLEHGFTRENDPPAKLNEQAGAFAYPREKLHFSTTERPNILIIVVDSLRGDFLTPEIMPHLFARSQTGSRFLHHYSGGNCTMTGMFTLFYGIPGTYFNAALKYGTPSVVTESALTCGYDIGIFSSAGLTGPPLDRTIFCNIRPLRIGSTGKNAIERDCNAADDLMTFLQKHDQKQQKRPYFAMLMLDHVHANAQPENYPRYFPTDLAEIDFMKLNNFDDALPARVLNCFRNIAHFSDEVLENIFVRLEKAGALENTIVIFTSDHGQEANETRTDSWQHNSNYTRYQIHAPMIVWGFPDRPKEIGHVTTHMDVAVTLLRAMGCTNPSEDFSTGCDLFDPADRGAVVLSSYLNRAIFYRGQILELTQQGAVLSYDLDGKKMTPRIPGNAWQSALEQIGRFIR